METGLLIPSVYVIHANGYDSHVTILRGAASILASITGLLLVYGIIFALEGMTTRVPTSAGWELTTGSLWTALWLLLFFSGLQDLVNVTHKQWVLWFGVVAALVFLYYFDRYTSLSLLTKAAMPPIATGLGLVPHFIKRMGFVFALSSLAVGVMSATVLCHFATTMLSPTAHFATRTIGALIVIFCVTGITSGLLVGVGIYRQTRRFFA
ncbi:MAG TPA: hypothetical protein VLW06_14225 [Terriglobales bacterium]|nr:hypothetical protein [Terriglobales bacterium]